ncbi:HAD-IIB family hydrolase [Sphingomonas canadensis]|uniref:HAD-IIB family hydrolase n=1 Tax=Sphingomonas canadensis TaxID=1219257 RepID=A0ABW3H8T7_9SPHN|nr:HAD-IIB family hydrolase [Sphingomonas canadensis]MCW3837318.1 HAD-IIB family hydrolase [Sphingomonas canadensis]
MIALVAFDLDGTLAESKQPMDPVMAGLLRDLLAVVRVAIISGGGWGQFEHQMLEELPGDADRTRLYLMPTSGTQLYRFEGDWRKVYAEDFTQGERVHILRALHDAVDEAGFSDPRLWGDRIEDRGSQITFSGLGQKAPPEAKSIWDPDGRKRARLQALLAPMLPGFAVRIGGSTSVDITRQGIDKAYGILKLLDLVGIAAADALFVGDALYPGGNDAPVQRAGIASIAVRGVGDTRRVIETILGSSAERGSVR